MTRAAAGPPPARDAAFGILLRVEEGSARASSLLRRLAPEMSGRERALTTELVLGTLRWQAKLDHALAQCASRPVGEMDPPVRVALRLAAHQVLHLERIPDRAAVDESVRLVRAAAGRPAGGFANGVLRALCRTRLRWPGPEEPPERRLSILQSHPEWLVRRWLDRMGEPAAEAALAAANRPAPITLRVNRARTDREALRRRLESEGVRSRSGRWSPDALRVEEGAPTTTAAFADGWFYLQDEASQLVAALAVPDVLGWVADLCAAPGGKATDLAARLGGGVVAADRSARRLQLLRDNLRRLGLGGVALLAADAGAPALAPSSAAAVLVDAPCSGTGILRRQPEIRWRRSATDIARLATEQARMLAAAADVVRPGGRLVYSVCSLEPEEGDGVVRDFLARRRDFQLQDPRSLPGIPPELVVDSGVGPHLATTPREHDLDGFFAAALQRQPA